MPFFLIILINNYYFTIKIGNTEILPPNTGIKESNVEQFRRQRYQAAFGIESWHVHLSTRGATTKPTPTHIHNHTKS